MVRSRARASGRSLALGGLWRSRSPNRRAQSACCCEGFPQAPRRQPRREGLAQNPRHSQRQRPPLQAHNIGFEVGIVGQLHGPGVKLLLAEPGILQAGKRLPAILVAICEKRPGKAERPGKTRKGAGTAVVLVVDHGHALGIQAKCESVEQSGQQEDLGLAFAEYPEPGEKDFAADAARPVFKVLQVLVLQQSIRPRMKSRMAGWCSRSSAAV